MTIAHCCIRAQLYHVGDAMAFEKSALQPYDISVHMKVHLRSLDDFSPLFLRLAV